MRKAESSHEMAAEYDFSGGVRGKYATRYAEGTNVVLLAEDVARAFPTSEAVNRALRGLIRSQSDEPQKQNRRRA